MQEPRAGKVHYSPVYFRDETEPYMTIAVAGRGSDPGVVAAEVNLKFILDVVSRIKVGKAGRAYAVDDEGILIAHPDISLVLRKTNLSSLSQVQAALASSSNPGSQRVDVMVAQNYAGQRVLTTYQPIAPLGWRGFWSNKLRYLRSRGVYTYYGRVSPTGQEKGVDVSLSIDLVKLTYEQAYDVAIIVSQDWDFGPAVRLAKEIARGQDRHLIFESAFPLRPSSNYRRRGIPGTTWIAIDKALYDSCYDPTDYRPGRVS